MCGILAVLHAQAEGCSVAAELQYVGSSSVIMALYAEIQAAKLSICSSIEVRCVIEAPKTIGCDRILDSALRCGKQDGN